MRRTKIICTIGPKTCHYEKLQKLAERGMNVARLNMSHGDYEWHRKVIKAIKTLNKKAQYSIAVLIDTKGPEIRSGDVKHEIHLDKGDELIFTVRREAEYAANCVDVSYDGFIDDVQVDDRILVDGGLLKFRVKEKNKKDIICECRDGGTLTSRRHLNILGRSANLPSITEKDWKDIEFGIAEGVDFFALSFVKNAQVITDLKKYLGDKKVAIDVIAKIESAAAIPHIDEIIQVADGVMVARGDLGAEIPLEEVPLLQEEIVEKCRKIGNPVIVATHLLESMIVNPTPTRAEVTDISEAVKEGADAIMLSGETASGNYPFKAISVMNRVACRMEQKILEDKEVRVESSSDSKEEIATSASIMANNLHASGIIVITRRGYMAKLLARCRPNSMVYAFTNTTNVRRKLNLYWGINPFRIDFSNDPEKTIQRAINSLKGKELIKEGERVIIVSDILAGEKFVETIQVRKV